jgi:NADH-ubiquinone oxidoreductase chain 2
MLLYSIVFLLLSNAANSRRDLSILLSRISIIILLCSSFLIYINLFLVFLGKGIGLFGGLLHSTSYTHVFTLFIFILSGIILILSSFYPRKLWVNEYSSPYVLFFCKLLYYKTKIINKMAEQFRILEYSLIILFIVCGAIFFISTSDLVSIFLSIELQSYGLYLISTIYRNSELSTKAGLTYFLLGSLSSCIILLSQSLLYINSGNTNLDGLYIITSISEIFTEENLNLVLWYKPNYIQFSLVIMSVGFLFKVSAAPFHFWSPDVYDSIPTIVTTFVAIIAKVSIFIFFLELVHYTSKYLPEFDWFNNSLLLSSLLSLIVGTVVGLTQFRIKRLYAYSTISHIGFILLTLSIHSIESIQAFVFYIIQYSISNLNAFIILISIGFSFLYTITNNEEYKNLKDINNSPIQLISQLKGFFYRNTILALSLAITLFSFIGVPPLIGFFAKQMVLSAALDNGYIFMSLIAILTSVISAVYYLVVIKQIFFDKDDYLLHPDINNLNLFAYIKNKNLTKIPFNYNNIVLSSSLSITVSVLTLIVLFFMLIPNEFLNITNILALILFM